MIAYPNAKINLGLNIIARRDDGYHDIESVMYAVPWRDIVEIVENPEGRAGQVIFTRTGITVPNDGKPDLCERAYHLLRSLHEIPSVKMHLHKQIPIGAGLGGGSADAAFVLCMLNELFDLGQTDEQLSVVAADLGSDCPFFVENRPRAVYGRGEMMENIELSLAGMKLLIIYPKLHIGTAEAYAGVRPTMPTIRISDVLKRPIEQWKDILKNDFESSIFEIHPILKHVKQELYDNGAVYASMSGSGSALYGIFKERKPMALADDVIWRWMDL
jgi:4-diphosphocytidyl-2-C-methyl-D-erythritol kinase